MRKLLLMAALAITISASAHHIDALGWCVNGKAVFQTAAFSNNLDVQVEKVVGGPNIPIYSFSTPIIGSTVTMLTVIQPNRFIPVTIRFRYKPHGSLHWGEWSSNITSSSSLYVGCSSLPVRMGRPTATWTSPTTIDVVLEIQESMGETVLKFNLVVPNGGMRYEPASFKLPATTTAGYHLAKLSYIGGKWIVNSIKPVI